MDPDRTYITVLPGHSRPAFVRKPRRSRENPFGLTAIARALAPAPRRRRSYSAQYLVRVRSYSPTYSRAYVSPPPPLYYQTSSQPTVMTHETVHTYPTSVQYSPPVLEQQGVSDLVTTKVITHNGRAEDNTLQHTCSACGKYRSASYQSRHPLAPGEIPKPGTCRHCIRKHTSSEDSEQEARRLRRLYRYDKCRKRSRYQYRYGRDAHSTATYSSSSPSKEEIQVHETRLISHDRHRSSSSSRDKARIRVTIEPERRRRGRRRESIEPVNVIKRTRHVDQGEWSRSRSRDSRRFDHEHPNSIQVCKDDHGRTTRHMVAQSYQPREFRTIEYGYDGNLPREGKTTRPVIRRRSASSLDQHTARYRIEEKETIESRERSYCRPNSIQRRNMDRSYTSRSSDTRCRERPTNSVRILRMSQETEDEIRTYNSEPPALQRRVSFVEDRSPSCSSTRRQLGEQKNPVVIHRRREVRDTHSESSDEVSLHGMTLPGSVAVHDG